MFDFKKLQADGYNAMKQWHQSNNLSPASFEHLIPCVENHYNLDFKSIENCFPEIVRAMSLTPQDQKYHFEGDVWTHTKLVMESLIGDSFYQNTSVQNQHILFWASLLHDVAKPITVDFNVDKGQITNENHSNKGASDVRLFMWKNNFNPKFREIVARLVQYHQRPFHWGKKMSAFELQKWSQSLPLDLLISLAKADILGRKFKNIADDNTSKIIGELELMEYLAEEENCLSSPWRHNFDSVISKKTYFDENGAGYVDRKVFYEGGSDVILLSGLPASGKNYWVDKFGEGKPVLSYDEARERLGLKQGKDGKAVQEVKERMKELLRKKEPFIINATHINEELRAKNLALLKAYNATIRIVHLEADHDTLKKRNEERKDNIPEHVILSMARKWSPPSALECHELMWWDRKKEQPLYDDYVTSDKDLSSPWKFAK